MFVTLISSAAVQFSLVALGILSIASLLVAVYVMRRGLSLVIAQIQGVHIFQGEIFTHDEWLFSMREVHAAQKRREFIDPESLHAYKNWMATTGKKTRSRSRR